MSYLERYLTPLLPFIIDTTVLEVSINTDGRVWVERAGDRHMKRVDVAPWSPVLIADLGLQIANSAREKLTEESPIVSTTIRHCDADLRAQVIVAPAVIGGAAISFRLFRGADRAARPHAFSFLRDPFRSMEEERRELLQRVVGAGQGEDVDPLLKAIVDNRLNVIVSGGTSTGKTELGRRLLSMVDPAERIVTIEDSAELLSALPNVVSLIASREVGSRRSADALLQASLRLRPDRIILGELRGSEAATFLDAINTGHSGSFTTIHAETARKAMERLALLVLATGTRLPDKKAEPWPVMVMLDEFDQLGPMPIVEQALKQLAGHGARVSIITQSIPGLDNIYGENIRLSLESAAGMKLFLSPNEKKTAAEVSEGLGKTTKLSVSDSLSRDQGLRARRSISRRMEERPLLSPDEIKRLSPQKVILLPERQNPIMADRIVYFEDPTFQALIEKQTGPLPYPPVEIAEIAALRAEVAELREQFGAIRHRRRTTGLAALIAVAPEEVPPAAEPTPAERSAEDNGDDLFAAFAGEIVADLQSFGNVVDERRQIELAAAISQIAPP